MVNENRRTTFGERLKRARARKGLSLRDLAAKLKAAGVEISHTAIGHYENAVMMPDSGKLIALCDILDVEPDYFFRSESVRLEKIEFRKLSRFGAKKVDQIRESAADFFERYLEIESILDLNPKPMQKIDLHEINADDQNWLEHAEAAAQTIRAAWCLGSSALTNVHELLESQGVKVKEVESDAGFDGFSGWADQTTPVIVLSKRLNTDLPRKRFTSLHELGHLAIDFPDSLDKKQREQFANRFAGAMLIPRDALIRNLGRSRPFGISMMELKAIKEDWGVSVAALCRRALDLDIITPAIYKSFCIRNRNNRKKEPGEWLGSESANRFTQLVIRALSQQAITRSKASELLRLNSLQLDKLMNDGFE